MGGYRLEGCIVHIHDLPWISITSKKIPHEIHDEHSENWYLTLIRVNGFTNLTEALGMDP